MKLFLYYIFFFLPGLQFNKHIPFCSEVYNSLDLSQNVFNAVANSFTSFIFPFNLDSPLNLKGYCLLACF